MMIDTHAHVDMDSYDEDREETIQRARDSGVKYMVNIGCDVESSLRSVELVPPATGSNMANCGMGCNV